MPAQRAKPLPCINFAYLFHKKVSPSVRYGRGSLFKAITCASASLISCRSVLYAWSGV